MLIRLDKYLADTGFGTRSTVKQLIKKNAVTVDGITVKSPDAKVDTENSVVTVNGKAVEYETFEYYMLNKPAGIISASTDEREKTVVDIISEKKRRDLFPVGRLDRDTVGLLLITNDGGLSQKLLAPGKHVEKVYLVRVTGKLDEEDISAFEEGMDIGDEKLTKPAKLEIKRIGMYNTAAQLFVKNDVLDPEANTEIGVDTILKDDGKTASVTDMGANLQTITELVSEAEVTLTEGRFHQIKRMFSERGHEVVYLKRLRMGSLQLDETLKEGGYRKLTEEELKALKA